MKPLVLKMSAFGPYAKLQIIDFQELNKQGLFLIHGPTGAGKTTILDAICFALYGVDSHLARESLGLRSDYAATETETAVTLLFALGQEHYYVERCLPKQQEKIGGAELSASLWQMPIVVPQPQDTPAATGVLIATGWQEVTAAIEELLHLQNVQFRQVACLPQGEFCRLLLAQPGERQSLLTRLFPTEQYRQLTEQLTGAAAELRLDQEEIRRERNWLLQQSGVATYAELAKWLQVNKQRCQKISEEIEFASQQSEILQTDVTEAIALAARLQERDRVCQLAAKVESQAVDMENVSKSLTEAKMVRQLTEQEWTIFSQQQQTNELAKLCQQREEILLQARTQAEQTAVRLAETQAYEESLQKEGLLSRLQGYANALQVLQDKYPELEQQREQLACWQQEKLQMETEFAVLAAEQEEKTAHLRELKKEAALAESWQQAAVALQILLTDKAKLAQLTERLQQLEAENTAEKLKADELETNWQAGKTALEILQVQWLQTAAKFLAKKLQPGEACPVCGALEHKQCAEIPAEELHYESELADLQTSQDALLQERQSCREHLSAQEKEAAILSSQLEELHTKLSLASQEEREKDEEKLEAELVAAQKKYEEIMAVSHIITAKETEFTLLTEKLQKLQKQQVELDKQIAAADAALAVRAEFAAEQLASVPTALQSGAAVAQAIAAAEQEAQDLKAKCALLRQEAQQAANQQLKAQLMLDTSMSELLVSQSALHELRENFRQDINKAGFASEEAYKLVRKTEGEIREMERKLSAFAFHRQVTAETLQRAQEGLADAVQPEIGVLQQQLFQNKQYCQELLREQVSLEQEVSLRQEIFAKLADREDLLTVLTARYELIEPLAKTASGDNEQKLTLQQYALTVLLNKVLVAANLQLQQLSRGRYQLRQQKRVKNYQRQAINGADLFALEVVDNYTGQAREISTLSGGETFLASLAMSLGLAEVVQACTGNVQVEMIFIDEGFNTLDPESLDVALDALLQMQSGERLVGVISHMPELKERIEARLLVQSAEFGSQVVVE